MLSGFSSQAQVPSSPLLFALHFKKINVEFAVMDNPCLVLCWVVLWPRGTVLGHTRDRGCCAWTHICVVWPVAPFGFLSFPGHVLSEWIDRLCPALGIVFNWLRDVQVFLPQMFLEKILILQLGLYYYGIDQLPLAVSLWRDFHS